MNMSMYENTHTCVFIFVYLHYKHIFLWCKKDMSMFTLKHVIHASYASQIHQDDTKIQHDLR